MNLETYLQELKQCDESVVEVHRDGGSYKAPKLTAEFGVHDGYTIALDVNKQKFGEFLRSNFKIFSESDKHDDHAIYSYYKPGTIVIDTQFLPRFKYPEHRRDGLGVFPARHYNTSVVLQLSAPKIMQGTSPTRAMAQTIDLIGNYVLTNNTLACFVNSRGATRDFSRVVYHPLC